MSDYIKNIFLTFSRQVLSLILGLLTAALIARYLGVENRGIYALIILLPTTLYTLLNFGLSSSIVFFIGKNNNRIEDIIKSTNYLSFILTTLSVLIGIIVILFFKDTFFNQVKENYLILSLLFLPAFIVVNFLQSILIGFENFKTLNAILIFQPVFFIALITLNLMFDFGLQGILAAEIITNYVILFITASLIKKFYFRGPGKLSKTMIISKLKYGFKNHAANVISFFEYRLDLLMVSYYLELRSVGAYVIAVNIAEKLWMVASSVSGVLFSRIVNLNQKEQKINITIYSAKVVFLISSIMGIILYFTSNILILKIFGEEYRASILPFNYLLPGIVMWSVVKVYSSYIAGEGKPEYNVYVSIISVIINLILNLYLIPIYGLKGAALATTIAYSINYVLRLLVFYKMSQVSLLKIILPTKTEITIIKTILKKGHKTNE